MTRIEAVGVALSLSLVAGIGPRLAAREAPAGAIRWERGMANGASRAIARGKPLVLILAVGPGENSRKMARVATEGRGVNALAGEAVFAWQDVDEDDDRRSIARMLDRRGIDRFPTTLVLDYRAGEVIDLGRVDGYRTDEELAGDLRRILGVSATDRDGIAPPPATTTAPPPPPPSAEDPPGGFAPALRPAPPRDPMEAQARAAGELFERSGAAQDPKQGDLSVAFAHYFAAQRGYRLARHWVDQGLANHPDARFGYQDARAKLAKARATLEAARAIRANRGDADGLRACSELAGHIDSLSDQVDRETSPPARPDPRPAPKPWRAPYGVR